MAGWYSASKHAVEALSDALRLEVAPFGIRVVLIEPGAIKTGFDEIALGTLDDRSPLDAYLGLSRVFDRLVRHAYGRAPGPEVVAAAVLRAVAARRPRARYALPNDARALVLPRRFLPDAPLDRLIRSQIHAPKPDAATGAARGPRR